MGTPLKVLIVEDEAMVAELLSFVVEDAGHQPVGPASSGPEALGLVSKSGADVALLDIRLEGDMDGIELAYQLKTAHKMRFIFISGSGDPQYLQRARAAGPLAFLQKPFNPDQLTAALNKLAAE